MKAAERWELDRELFGDPPRVSRTNPALALAESCAAVGLPAFPVEISWDDLKGKTNKAPLNEHGHLGASCDTRELRGMFNKAVPRRGGVLGVGVHPGPAGYLVVDVDDPANIAAFDERDLPATYTVTTASGSRHYWYAKPESVRVGTACEWTEVDVIRSDDGWVVAPGVETPWGPWESFDEFPTDVATCPPELWAACDTGGTGGKTTAATTADLENLLVSLRADGREQDADALAVLVERYGAHHPYMKGTELFVTRPDKSAGPSASIGYVGPGVVKVFTSNWPGFAEGHRYVVEGKTLVDSDDLDNLVTSDRPPPVEAPTSDAIDITADERRPLRRVDLGPAWRGERVRPEAVFLVRSDGVALFPAGIDYIFGDSGDGKSWIELVASLQQIRSQRHVVWVTYEDPNEDDIVERLKLLGADEHDLEYFHLFTPSEPLRSLVVELARYCRQVQAVALVLDSVGEALAVEGVNEDRDNEFGPWARETFRRLYDLVISTGPDIGGEPCPTFAINPVDHSTKSKDNPHFPSGTKRKRAMVTGLMVSVNVRQPFARGQFGRVQLVCAKDRSGRFRRGEIVAEFVLDATAEPYEVHIDPPATGAEMAAAKRRNATERLLEVIEDASVPLTAEEVARIANTDAYRLANEAELVAGTVRNALAKLTGIVKAKEPTGTASGYRITYAAEVVQ